MCKDLIKLERSCSFTVSGVRQLWVAKYNKDLEYSITEDQLLIFGTLDFTELELDKGSGSLTLETSLTANGHITQVNISASFSKAEQAKLKALMRTTLSDKLYVLVLDNNGLHWFIGIENGAKVRSLLTTLGTGQDFNGHTLTIVSTSANPYSASQITVGGEFNEDFNNDFNNE